MKRSSKAFVRAAWLFLILVPAISGVGCDPKPGSVSGKVLFTQKPLPGGRITFADDKGHSYGAEISETGEYSIKDILPGTYQVGVRNDNLKMAASMPAMPGGGAPVGAPVLKGHYVPLPEKFFDGKTSGVSVTIGAGSQSKDIELK